MGLPHERHLIQREQHIQTGQDREDGPGQRPAHQIQPTRQQRARQESDNTEDNGIRFAEQAEERSVHIEQPWRIQRVEVSVRQVAAQHSSCLLEEVAFVEGIDAEANQRQIGQQHGQERQNGQSLLEPWAAVDNAAAVLAVCGGVPILACSLGNP